MITFRYSSTNLNHVESTPLFFHIAPFIMDWQSNSPSLKKRHDDSYTALRYRYVFAWEPDGLGVRGTLDVVGLLYFLSRRSREVYSEVAPRRDVQHPRRARSRSAFHGDYHIACHIVGAPYEGEARRRRKRGRRRWGREKGQREMAAAQNGGERVEDVDANRIAIYPRARRL